MRMAAGLASSMWFQHVAALVAVFICGILGSCLPIWMRHSRHVTESRRAYFLSMGSCFGGGVFVAASFIHLLADASVALDVGTFETMCNATACTVTKLADPYPWAMLACSGGILFTMVLTESIRSNVVDGTTGAGSWPDERPPASPYSGMARHDDVTPARPRSLRGLGGSGAGDTEDDAHHRALATAKSPLVSPAARARSAGQGRSLNDDDDGAPLLPKSPLPSGMRPGRRNSEICSAGAEFLAAASERETKRSILGAVMLFFALSFHSFIVGLALGLAPNIFGTLFIAVIAHKSIAGFALGASFADAIGRDGKPISKMAMSVDAPPHRRTAARVGFHFPRLGLWLGPPCLSCCVYICVCVCVCMGGGGGGGARPPALPARLLLALTLRALPAATAFQILSYTCLPRPLQTLHGTHQHLT